MSLHVNTNNGIFTLTGSRDHSLINSSVTDGNLRCVYQVVEYTDDNVNWEYLATLLPADTNAFYDTTGATSNRKYRVKAVYGSQESPPSNVVSASTLASGLLAYYALETNGNDSTANARHLTAGTATSLNFTATSKSGSALFADNYWFVGEASPSYFNFNASSYTFSFWFRSPYLVDQCLVDWGSFGGIPTRINSGGIAHLLYDGSTWNYATSTVSLSVDTWYHCVSSYNYSTGQLRIRINNETGNGTNTTNSVAYANVTGGPIFSIGRESWGYNSDGIIDEVGVWNRALTDAEITQLYNAGAGRFYPL